MYFAKEYYNYSCINRIFSYIVRVLVYRYTSSIFTPHKYNIRIRNGYIRDFENCWIYIGQFAIIYFRLFYCARTSLCCLQYIGFTQQSINYSVCTLQHDKVANTQIINKTSLVNRNPGNRWRKIDRVHIDVRVGQCQSPRE